jgi:hypothetical protein
MNTQRIIVLALALVAAMGAAFLVRGMMGGGTPQVIASAPPEIKMSEVLVAAVNLTPGQALDPEKVRWEKWPAASVSETFVTRDAVASAELAEELALTTAELSYLPDRRQAFDNLAKRCGHPGVKAVAIALNQAEKYGTPMGQALRVTAQENREMRFQAAEKKAAALPPKLTVPMILFFLPCLFVVIGGPAAMNAMKTLN